MNQSQFLATRSKRGKNHAYVVPLVLVLPLIGWKTGASLFSQSLRVAIAIAIAYLFTFHSHLKTTLYDGLQFILTIRVFPLSTLLLVFSLLLSVAVLKELTKRSEEKKQNKTHALDGAVLVGTVKLIEIKVSSEACTYDLSDCIFSWEQAFLETRVIDFRSNC